MKKVLIKRNECGECKMNKHLVPLIKTEKANDKNFLYGSYNYTFSLASTGKLERKGRLHSL